MLKAAELIPARGGGRQQHDRRAFAFRGGEGGGHRGIQRFHHVERHYGVFSRSFSLSPSVDASRISAEYSNGVLTVRLPLREDAKRILQQDAQWLSKWPQAVIRIDGHCDERGTPEYNLSLGDRRAQVVREYLTNLGVRPERMQARSLGKEAPFCQDNGESCWSQNRRDHFEITGK